jgi:hypothetical protein
MHLRKARERRRSKGIRAVSSRSPDPVGHGKCALSFVALASFYLMKLAIGQGLVSKEKAAPVKGAAVLLDKLALMPSF